MRNGLRLLLTGLGVLILNVNLLAQPVITDQPTSQTVVWGANATFGVMATDVGALAYQWQLNGTNLPNNLLTTVAGGALFDGLQATNTPLNSPPGTAVDAAGNLYIADMNNHVVRKIGTDGVAHIVAGAGVMGFAGDGGMATNALLSQPTTVAVDTNGNLYLADTGNNRIRKVDTNGIIVTVAGNGATFGSSGLATNTSLYYPYGIAVDKVGNLYIADDYHQYIRKVDASGNISNLAGTGTAGSSGGSLATSAQLNYPQGVAVDAAGNIYIADTGNNRVRKITGSQISTISGTGTAGYSGNGGSATAAQLKAPNAVSVDAAGNLYIADTGNQCIRKITNSIITTVAGTNVMGFSGDGGPATNANLSSPTGVTADQAGNIFIADGSGRIRKVGPDGIINTVAGKRLSDGEAATNATLNMPSGAVLDSAGNFYVADTANHRVRKIDTNGIISTYAGNGLPAFAGDGGPATNASLAFPYGVAVDASGNVFVADQANRRIRKVDMNGIISTVAGKGSAPFSGDGGAATNAGFQPNAVWADRQGNLFIADSPNYRIRKVDTNGTISTVAGNGSYSYSGDGGLATTAGIGSPTAVAFDPAGNMFIASSMNNRIRKVDTNGIITTVAGDGNFGDTGDGGLAINAQMKYPFGVAADALGNVFFSDASSARIRKIGTNGLINTVSGNGLPGPAIDNVSGNGANLAFPRGICTDGNGNLYIADCGANRLRKLTHIDYANQPSFTVTGVTTNCMGNHYSVLVTSASGSVTSSVVTVSVQLPPIVPTVTASAGIFQFTWNAVANLTYQLQSTTNLTEPNWQDVGSPVAAATNSVSVTAPVGAEGQHFYRVRLWP